MKKNIEIRDLVKRFGKKEILKGIDMDIPCGELLSILGPSGAGKTTLLKILAGIDDADSGRVTFPSDMEQSPVLVFQDYQLFPYMSVFSNIAFGLQARGASRKEVNKRVKEMSHKLGIFERLNAYPSKLSGGEKQRCALARALVLNPPVILLDEPFSNLDKNLKGETAHLLKGIQRDFNLTMISVTHDQEEAMMLSDTMALLIGGEVKEFGEAELLYRRPQTLEGAGFLGQVNYIPENLHPYFKLEEKESVYCRPGELLLKKSASGSATVVERFFTGPVCKYSIKLGESSFEVFSSHEKVETGETVDLVLNDYFTLPVSRDERETKEEDL